MDSRLSLRLEGAREIMDQLEAIQARINALGTDGAGASSGAGPMGAGPAQGSMPATPSLSPGSLSNAAATAGTAAVGKPGAIHDLIYGPPAGSAPAPSSPGTGGSVGDMIGAMYVGQMLGQQIGGTINQGLGSYSQSMVNGTPFHAMDLIPGAISIAGMGAGYAIGGPVGAAIGATAAAAINAAATPVIGHKIRAMDIDDIVRAQGLGEGGYDYAMGLYTDVQSQVKKDLTGGRSLDRQTYDIANRLVDPGMRERYLETMHQGTESKGYIARYGLTGLDRGTNTYAAMQEAMLVDPQGALQSMRDTGYYAIANKWEKEFVEDVRRQQQSEVTRADIGVIDAETQAYGRKRGSTFIESQATRKDAKKLSIAADLEWKAFLSYQDPFEAAKLKDQAQALRIEADAPHYSTYDTAVKEINDKYGAQSGMAHTAFEGALGKGTAYESLDFNSLRTNARQQAKELQAELNSFGGNLSEGARARMRYDIAKLEQEAGQGVNQYQDQLKELSRNSSANLNSATYGLAHVNESLYGTFASTSKEEFGISRNKLQEKLHADEESLRLMTDLNDEKRKQLQAAIATTKTDLVRLDASEKSAALMAAYNDSMMGVNDRRASASVDMIYGRRLPEAQAEMVTSARDALSVAQQELAKAETPADRQKFSNLVNQARYNLASTEVALALPPVDTKDQIAMSNLGVLGHLAQAGYLEHGMGRQVIQGQIGLVDKQIGAIEDRLKSATEPNIIKELTFERNRLENQRIDLKTKYDDGWEQRLVWSQYDMSSAGLLASSSVSRREMAHHGIGTRNLGGSFKDSQEARFADTTARYLTEIGVDTPQGFKNKALEATIHVFVHDASSGNVINQSKVSIKNQQTASVFNKPGQAGRPGA